jgi:hypothetical protein
MQPAPLTTGGANYTFKETTMPTEQASIYSDPTGVNGDLTRGEIVERASSALADYVYEVLAGDYGVTYGTTINTEVLHAVGRLVARAMLDQHAHTEKINNGMFVASLGMEESAK